MIADNVNPGKYGPIGKSIAPKKSESPAIIAEGNAPKSIAPTTTGMNETPNFIFHNDIEKNLESMICIEIKIAIQTNS